MSARYLAALLVFAGCGPTILPVDETDTAASSSGPNGTQDGATDITGRPPPPATDDGGTTDAQDAGSSDDGPPPLDCWQVQPMFEAPSNAGMLIRDQNLDGRQEIWLLFDADGGPGPGETTIFAIDDSGTPLAELVVNGFLQGLGDIEGDGLLDLVTISFVPGQGPFFAAARATGLAQFELPPAMLDLELSQNRTGFFDINGDGPADVVSLRMEGALEFSVGNGIGGFELVNEVLLDSDPQFVQLQPIDNSSVQGILLGYTSFDGELNCNPISYTLLDGSMGQLDALASSPAGDQFGFLRRAEIIDDGSTVIYTDTCDNQTESHGLRPLRWNESEGQFQELPGVSAMQWATVGDFNGDGFTDRIYAEPGAPTISLALGAAGLQLEAAQSIGIAVEDTRDNRVQAADLDGDGRDELVRGVVVGEGEPAQLLYERVFFGPC